MYSDSQMEFQVVVKSENVYVMFLCYFEESVCQFYEIDSQSSPLQITEKGQLDLEVKIIDFKLYKEYLLVNQHLGSN